MTWACRDIEALIDRRAGGLADAERLVLEQHLGECAECRDLSDAMKRVVATLEEAPATLSESARERAMARAFANVEAGAVLRESRASLRRLGAWAAAAAALALCVRLTWSLAGDDARTAGAPAITKPDSDPVPAIAALPSDTPAEQPPSEPEGSRAAIAAGDEAAAAPKQQPWYEAKRRETKLYAQAEVELEPGTRLRFQPESATLELDRGRVQVDVEPSRERPFSVVTRNFRVQVLGTAFSVSPERVTVQRGRVQVFARDGQVLARELSQGATFTYRESAKARARQGAADEPEQPQAAAATTSAAPDVTVLLRDARAELGRGDLSAARALIERAEQSGPTRTQSAEAATLRAEAAMLDHDRDGAIRTYARIAAQFAELPAGENAAFAAAQLKARSGDEAGARSLFESYLARYPQGRFAEEARARLSRFAK